MVILILVNIFLNKLLKKSSLFLTYPRIMFIKNKYKNVCMLFKYSFKITFEYSVIWKVKIVIQVKFKHKNKIKISNILFFKRRAFYFDFFYEFFWLAFNIYNILSCFKFPVPAAKISFFIPLMSVNFGSLF